MKSSSSIAMATYNGAAFLQEQLDTFSAQTRLPDELVVTDDGSTDPTVEIIEQFARTAPFHVQVHRNQERLNYPRNFERAVSLCSGEIIFLSDQDDVWFPEKIETVIAEFGARPEIQVVVNDQILTDETLKHSGLTMLANLERIGRTSDGLIAGCSTAFRRTWAEKFFPMPLEADQLIQAKALAHDQWIHRFATLLGVRSVLRRPLQLYRRTGRNTSSWVVSEPRPVRLGHLIQGRVPAAPTDEWSRRVTALKLYEDYLRSHRLKLDGDFEAAMRELTHERSSIEHRIALTNMPWLLRIPAVWRLWRSGGYRYFERWMSAANDLTRSAGRPGSQS